MSKKKQTIVALDKEQIEWLENKVNNEGYSKSGLIRQAIKRLMQESNKIEKTEVAEIKTKSNEEPYLDDDKPIKIIPIEKILDVLIKFGESGKFDKYNIPNMPEVIETAKNMQEKLKNIDHLHPLVAFEVGKFKGEMEIRFSQAIYGKAVKMTSE
jgi:Arc/MetJ-type ribon-helix-helix transcriptional regulator